MRIILRVFAIIGFLSVLLVAGIVGLGIHFANRAPKLPDSIVLELDLEQPLAEAAASDPISGLLGDKKTTAEAPPARLIIARTTCRNEKSPLSRLKTLNYLDSIIARREATARGADDAILLNSLGRVAEATAANLFLSLDGHWVTPPVSEGALPGTMRAALLKNWRALERPVTVADLHRADDAVLTTALGMRKVLKVLD